MDILNFDHSYHQLGRQYYSYVYPVPSFKNSELIAWNLKLAKHLDLQYISRESIEKIFTLRQLPEDNQAIALAYAGHQFGSFNPRLGDGRALLLGEIVTNKGQRYDIQFKGSGPTDFSRGGDGNLPLGPAIREYLVSEAMYHLGIPTTRSLAIAISGETVYRQKPEPGAILTRVAQSHIRIGTFEYFAAQNDLSSLQKLVSYTIKRHNIEMVGKDEAKSLLKYVVEKQAKLIAQWMSVGFIHGVMNTDNCAVSGETIDYGPCAFLDEFQSDKVFSFIDRGGRYAYNNQALIGQWNCARLGDCLSLLYDKQGFHEVDVLAELVEYFKEIYDRSWLKIMTSKLGLMDNNAEENKSLLREFLLLLQKFQCDFTLSFRNLSRCLQEPYEKFFPLEMGAFIEQWKTAVLRYGDHPQQIISKCHAVNPWIIPRNHMIQKVIDEAYKGDWTLFDKFFHALSEPYAENAEMKKFSLSPSSDEKVTQTFCGT